MSNTKLYIAIKGVIFWSLVAEQFYMAMNLKTKFIRDKIPLTMLSVHDRGVNWATAFHVYPFSSPFELETQFKIIIRTKLKNKVERLHQNATL